jgi:hypothetical protein
MPLYLQRLRFSVRTMEHRLAGTNSKVELHYVIDASHNHPTLEPDEYCLHLDHPFHDDFKRGAIDSYEIDLAEGSSMRAENGVAVPNGLYLADWNAARKLVFHLTIDGGDRWDLDRYILAGDFKELRPGADDSAPPEVVDLGWIEMARHEGKLSMSTNPDEGVAEIPIALDGSWQ